MAMEAFITPFPSIADSTMAERIPGKAIMASTPLITTTSTALGERAATAPIKSPTKAPKNTLVTPTAKADLVDTRILE